MFHSGAIRVHVPDAVDLNTLRIGDAIVALAEGVPQLTPEVLDVVIRMLLPVENPNTGSRNIVSPGSAVCAESRNSSVVSSLPFLFSTLICLNSLCAFEKSKSSDFLP